MSTVFTSSQQHPDSLIIHEIKRINILVKTFQYPTPKHRAQYIPGIWTIFTCVLSWRIHIRHISVTLPLFVGGGHHSVPIVFLYHMHHPRGRGQHRGWETVSSSYTGPCVGVTTVAILTQVYTTALSKNI